MLATQNVHGVPTQYSELFDVEPVGQAVTHDFPVCRDAGEAIAELRRVIRARVAEPVVKPKEETDAVSTPDTKPDEVLRTPDNGDDTEVGTPARRN